MSDIISGWQVSFKLYSILDMIPTFIDTFCDDLDDENSSPREELKSEATEFDVDEDHSDRVAAASEDSEPLEPVGNFCLGTVYDLTQFRDCIKCKHFQEDSNSFRDATIVVTAGAILLFDDTEMLFFWASLPSVGTLR